MLLFDRVIWRLRSTGTWFNRELIADINQQWHDSLLCSYFVLQRVMLRWRNISVSEGLFSLRPSVRYCTTGCITHGNVMYNLFG